MKTRRLLLPSFTALLITLIPVTLRAAPPALDVLRPSRKPHLLVIFIGGMDSDPTEEQIAGTAPRRRGNSGMFQLCGDMHGERVVAEYFNWNGTRAGALNSPQPPRSPAIAEFVRRHVRQHAQDRIALVGNSWGGHTAFEVAQDLRRHEAPLAVSLTVFLDAASVGRTQGQPKSVPDNVNRIVHFHTRNLFVWRRLPRDGRLETIDLGDPASPFRREGGPAYDAPFDFQAHVAAEWDERIHADIRRRLLDLLPAE